MSMSFIPAVQIGKRFEMVDVEQVNLGSANAVAVIRSIGCLVEDGGMETVEIDTFIDRCTRFLRSSLRNGPSPEIEAVVRRDPGRCTVFEGGREEGYIQGKVRLILDSAREGKEKGATHIYAG